MTSSFETDSERHSRASGSLVWFNGMKNRRDARLRGHDEGGRNGFSLVELAIVLGVMGIVLGTLWGIVSIVRENMKRDEAINQIALSVRHIRDYYLGHGFIATPGGNGSFTALTHFLLEQGILPPEMIRSRSAGTLRADHPWGGNGPGGFLSEGGFAVDNTGVAASADKFRIQLRGLKFSSCVALAARVSGDGPSGLRAVRINGTLDEDLPVTAEEASDRCEKNPSGENNKIDFIYRLRVQ